MNMTTTEKPYCTLELRQKLGLKPGQTDSVSMMLWSSLYASNSLEEFEDRIGANISRLLNALEIVRSIPQTSYVQEAENAAN